MSREIGVRSDDKDGGNGMLRKSAKGGERGKGAGRGAAESWGKCGMGIAKRPFWRYLIRDVIPRACGLFFPRH